LFWGTVRGGLGLFWGTIVVKTEITNSWFYERDSKQGPRTNPRFEFLTSVKV
jgi:hypothetical protein